MAKRDTTRAPTVRTVRSALLLGLLLVFADAFVLDQGIISAVIGVWLLAISLPRTCFQKFSGVRRQRLRNIGIYLAAVLLVFALNSLNNSIAQRRAEALVTAVKAFHSKYHHYPRSLGKLVPEFMKSVPVAKYTLTFNKFWYLTASNGDVLLFYVAMPPFGHQEYSFAIDRWQYMN